MNPTAHVMSLKGETSGNEQDGAFVVMPPTILEQVVQVAPGGVAILDGQFFPPLHTLSVIPQGGLPPSAAVSDPDGKLMVQIPVPPMAAPGTYPVLFQDSNDPVWIANNQPSVSIIVLPQPTDATGNWNLNATTTLKRDDGKVTANGVGTTMAQFAVSGGQLKGQGTLAITLDMSVGDASCHGEAAPTPFTVSGAASGGMFHLQFSGANAAITITVTCNNGLSLPTTLPGDSASAPFDIQATDGQTVDIDGSNTFLMVPPGFSGHTHVVLAKG
jgi:hypothetical protein